MDSFQQIEADKTFETSKFTVFEKGDIRILVPNNLAGVYFVRLFSQTPAPAEKKARLPKMITRFAFKDEILGLPVAKRRGDFTVPVGVVKRGDRSEEKYVAGSGILYYVPRYDIKQWGGMPPDIIEKVDRTAILQIMEMLSKENKETAKKTAA